MIADSHNSSHGTINKYHVHPEKHDASIACKADDGLLTLSSSDETLEANGPVWNALMVATVLPIARSLDPQQLQLLDED